MSGNIKKIAELAQTSKSSVSRVINNNGYVSADVRERVEKAIASINYHPNAGARTLRGSPSRLVGVLLPSLDVPFFGILAHSIEQAFFALGYQTFICSTAESQDREQAYVGMLLAQRIDGVIVASSRQEVDPFTPLRDRNIPMVAIDRPMPGLTDVCVHVDNHYGGTLLAKHLIELGHREIAIISTPRHSEPMIQRVNGACAALAEHGLKPVQIAYGNEHNLGAGRRLATKLLQKTPRPTAIIGTSDTAAIGAMHAAVDLGINVPGDLSIAGFDDIPEASYVLPRLTTVSQPTRKIGERAVHRLHQMMSGELELAVEDRLPLKLVVRQSTAKI
ncbi:LacI family transcriptional regulator [Rhizobium sp. P38BS-XIX]|uniref:LacI family DNA-binding transcriptional regulator n=1 Tax=Rhizobium sp. P38BS-XIX TaxID=2726740 RepID=UPI00145782DF|nr:LacI family DNA-binding transcriptional regulator [Rhizobium sp. P38BS-XIX]NLR99883.1 LacI family transcriptional regulator [Rhizobium sp. P38BS-XIX]